MVSQSSWRQPSSIHWQTGAHPNTWAAALAKPSEALNARGQARGSQGGSQKGTGQRRLWPCHWSCCRLPRSGNIPHRTRNHWMRRASRARLQLPGRDLKKPKQNKILQITIIWKCFCWTVGPGATMVWGCEFPLGAWCAPLAGERQGKPLTPPHDPLCRKWSRYSLLQMHQEWQSGTRWGAEMKGHIHIYANSWIHQASLISRRLMVI